MPDILIEGYTVDEILQLPNEQLEEIVLRDEPIVFKAGSATILGKFRVSDEALVLELAHIDGGGKAPCQLCPLWLIGTRNAKVLAFLNGAFMLSIVRSPTLNSAAFLSAEASLSGSLRVAVSAIGFAFLPVTPNRAYMDSPREGRG